MPSIDPANQLAALIRVQIAGLRQQRTQAPAGNKRSSPATASSAAASGPAPDIAGLVAQRIRAISPDDPQRERKALRMFLEAVLLAELGHKLVSDPQFGAMVDHVQSQMEGDPELAKASGEAARLLLKSADSKP